MVLRWCLYLDVLHSFLCCNLAAAVWKRLWHLHYMDAQQQTPSWLQNTSRACAGPCLLELGVACATHVLMAGMFHAPATPTWTGIQAHTGIAMQQRAPLRTKRVCRMRPRRSSHGRRRCAHHAAAELVRRAGSGGDGQLRTQAEAHAPPAGTPTHPGAPAAQPMRKAQHTGLNLRMEAAAAGYWPRWLKSHARSRPWHCQQACEHAIRTSGSACIYAPQHSAQQAQDNRQ